ncbi:SWIM zinc finger family protein [Serratia grimesii]
MGLIPYGPHGWGVTPRSCSCPSSRGVLCWHADDFGICESDES